ncbi:MAG: ring-cleaving dioxygenase [Rhizobiales bacterium]|nr:ring-cleaving dioxygenase [Hyphomicrobiales bacterium]
MSHPVSGLHHVTAIASDAQANVDFHCGVLGQRLVKPTVNFDDPGTYHLYYGDTVGTPGSLTTFFPYPGARRGRIGRSQAVATHLGVPVGSLEFWWERLARSGVASPTRSEFLGHPRLEFADPDGLAMILEETDDRLANGDPWTGGDVGLKHAILGLGGVTLAPRTEGGVEGILMELLGFHPVGEERIDGRLVRRFHATGALPAGALTGSVDVVTGAIDAGTAGAGTVHHVAFGVAGLGEQEAVRRAIVDSGLEVTPAIDRNYFTSIYFRTPGGILFEVATSTPGFLVDETRECLGTDLKLPHQHEPMRAEIEARLARLSVR